MLFNCNLIAIYVLRVYFIILCINSAKSDVPRTVVNNKNTAKPLRSRPGSSAQEDGNGPISRAALGSSALVGDLYDARTDELCGVSIFKRAPPSSTITLLDNPATDAHYMYEESYSDKFSKMDMGASLQADLLGGLLKVEGSARFLTDTKQSSRSVKTNLIYNIITKDESINLYHDDLLGAFSMDAIKNTKATHIVQEITWGADTILTCLYDNKEDHDITKIKGELTVMMEKAMVVINGQGSVEDGWGKDYTNINFKIRLFGDILIPDEGFPISIEDAANITRKIPSSISAFNNGKGKQLRYRLLPIETLKKHLKLKTKPQTPLNIIEDGKLLRVVQFFDQVLEQQQKLEAFYQNVLDYRYCLQSNDFDKISHFMTEMEIEQSKMKSNLAAVLIKVRTGEADVTELDKLLQQFHSSPYSPESLRNAFHNWTPIDDKIDFAKDMITKGVTYIGEGASFSSTVLEIYDSSCLVLFFSTWDTTKDSLLAQNKQFMLSEIAKKKNASFFMVDYNLQPSLAAQYNKATCVKLVADGEVVSEDLLQRRQRENKDSKGGTLLGIMHLNESSENFCLRNNDVKYGFIENMLADLSALTNMYRHYSYEYLDMSSHFKNFKANRFGFTKLFRRLSDALWMDSINLTKYMAKRGLSMQFEARRTPRTALQSVDVSEALSLARAVDIQKDLAQAVNSVHSHAYSDADTVYYMKNNFARKLMNSIRQLSMHTQNLIKIIHVGSSGPSKRINGSANINLFDVYLRNIY